MSSGTHLQGHPDPPSAPGTMYTPSNSEEDNASETSVATPSPEPGDRVLAAIQTLAARTDTRNVELDTKLQYLVDAIARLNDDVSQLKAEQQKQAPLPDVHEELTPAEQPPHPPHPELVCEDQPPHWKPLVLGNMRIPDMPQPPPGAPGPRNEFGYLCIENCDRNSNGSWAMSEDYQEWISSLWWELLLPRDLVNHPTDMSNMEMPFCPHVDAIADVKEPTNLHRLWKLQVALRLEYTPYDTWPYRVAKYFTGDFEPIEWFINSQMPPWPVVVEAVLTHIAYYRETDAPLRKFQKDCVKGPDSAESMVAYLTRLEDSFRRMPDAMCMFETAEKALHYAYHTHAAPIETMLYDSGTLRPHYASFKHAIRFAKDCKQEYLFNVGETQRK